MLEITILEENFMWKHKNLEITIYQPILIFEKCRKMGLLFPCKLKIPIFLAFTMYNVRYNLQQENHNTSAKSDEWKITILDRSQKNMPMYNTILDRSQKK